MGTIGRRAFLGEAAAATGAVLAGGPSQALLPGVARAQPHDGMHSLGPVADLHDGKIRLHLPAGFQYRSFHDTDGPFVVLADGTTLPGRHDGMGAFPGPDGNVWLVRNHEINGAGTAFGTGEPYDPNSRGGTTTTLVTPRGDVLDDFTSLNGTLLNSGGGRMPWGTWITCEETVNGPDVSPDFTNAPNIDLHEPHGFIFEIPAGGVSNREPITSAGRFAHDSAALDPREGILYLTEDNFSFPSGLFRYIPPTNPMAVGRIENGGRLQMLRVMAVPNFDLAVTQTAGNMYLCDWVDIEDPDPVFPYTPGEPAPTSNDDALIYVGDQGRAQGAAVFSRLEGATYTRGEIYFVSTQGGGDPEASFGPIANGYGDGFGQVWSYDPTTQLLTCRYQSQAPDALDGPDSITVRNERGTIVICEDGPADNYIRGFTRDGRLFDIALNRVTRNADPTITRYHEEFAGATFSPDGHTLFVNIQASNGVTFAIWGPWGRLGV